MGTKLAVGALIALALVWGCGVSGTPAVDGTGGGGVENPNVTGGAAPDAAGAGTGGGTDAKPDAPSPFAPQCAKGREPTFDWPSSCSFEQTCLNIGCDDGISLFGADGCYRSCTASTDCAEGQRCRFTALLGQDCATGSVEGCLLESDGSCSCSFYADCINPDICVDAKRFPVEEDCVVANATCQDLKFFPGPLELEEPGQEPSSEKRLAFAACREAVLARAAEINCQLR